MLKGKKILIGVTGSIAAYKIAFLVRLLKKEGAEVQLLFTPMAHDFITPLTLSTLSERPVLTEFFDMQTGEWNSHVEMGLWADLFLIAPLSANTMAKMATGVADNLLLTTYLSAKCPVLFAPAMDLDMYKHPATQNSIKILQSYGNILIEPTAGELASGLIGEGRMEEPDIIFELIKDQLKKKADLTGKRVLITAGPTFEAIDPVRFIGNHSSGKMGYSLANECAARGAEVILISGPSDQTVTDLNIELLKVTSADDMYNAVHEHFKSVDVAIMSAAVADFKPAKQTEQKIKKGERNTLTVELEPTKDILKSMGEIKADNQLLIGFALETEHEKANAKKKLENKNLNFIVLNSLNDDGAGFGYNTNKVCIMDRNGKETEFQLKSKQEVAVDIIDHLVNTFEKIN